jgi:hypothetical protein
MPYKKSNTAEKLQIPEKKPAIFRATFDVTT